MAEALFAEFSIGPLDMSIRPFYPQDYLVLCRSKETRNWMVARGHATATQFSLMLGPWFHQAQAIDIVMLYLVQLALRGVPTNAWTRRAAEAVLWGLGLIIKVADSTSR